MCYSRNITGYDTGIVTRKGPLRVFCIIILRCAMKLPARLNAALPQELSFHLRAYGWTELVGDLGGGLAASIVLIPLALGLGVMSGLGPQAGLYGAIVLAFFGALFGGVRGVVCGPNGLVALTVATVVAQFAASWTEALTIVILAGLFQIVIGLLKLGSYTAYIPYSLLAGLFTACGIQFLLNQSLPLMGVDPISGGPLTILQALPDAFAHRKVDALAVAFITFAAALLWRGPLRRLCPPQVVMLGGGVLASLLWFPDAPVLDTLVTGLPRLHAPVLAPDFLLRVVQGAFILALVASSDSLLIALHTTSITGLHFRPNQELVAQGLGNIVAGLVGGMPGAACMGTLICVDSKGLSPLAGLTVAAVLAAITFVLGVLLTYIPVAVIAVLIIHTGWNIIDWSFLRQLHRIPLGFVMVMLLTMILTLAGHVMLAIVAGLIVAGLTNSRGIEPLELSKIIFTPVLDMVILGDAHDKSNPFQANTGLVVFSDHVSIASARKMGAALNPDFEIYPHIIFDMSHVQYVDDTAAYTIGQIVDSSIVQQDKNLVICGMSDGVAKLFHSMNLLTGIPRTHFVPSQEEAQALIRHQLLQARAQTRNDTWPQPETAPAPLSLSLPVPQIGQLWHASWETTGIRPIHY